MYTINKEKVVHNYETEIVEYICDVCLKKEYSEEELIKHYGKTHSILATKTIGENKFYFISSKENYEPWKKCIDSDYVFGEFIEPGWYEIQYSQEPCGRGCCYREHANIKFIKTVIETKEKELQNKLDLINSLKELNNYKPAKEDIKIKG